MSNQFTSEFILNTSSPIALDDAIDALPQQLVRAQLNTTAAPAPATAWSHVDPSASASEINYNLLVNEGQQVAYSGTGPAAANIAQIPGQNMSQTAQLVLLPTQNINLVANVPKPEQMQMILPNDVGYQLISSIPNVSVLVPTNILLTNGYILIPNSQNSCQTLPIAGDQTLVSTQSSEATVTSNQNQIYLNQNWVEPNQECQQLPSVQQHPQPQLIAANVELIPDGQVQQLVPEQECEFIALTDTGTQTMLSGLADSELSQTAHLISNNGQIVGIIGSDQLGILQADPGGESGQVLLAIDPNESGGGIALAPAQTQPGTSYDINAVLASTLSTTLVGSKTDQNQAKQWLKDSYIALKALKALKKSNAGGSHHHRHSTRPHSQVRR